MNPAPVDVVREAPAPFVLLDGIAHVTRSELVGWRNFSEQPFWPALEAAAQAAALHQRWLADFGAHAFLLSLGACRWPDRPLTGRMELRARLLGQTAGAAAYNHNFLLLIRFTDANGIFPSTFRVHRATAQTRLQQTSKTSIVATQAGTNLCQLTRTNLIAVIRIRQQRTAQANTINEVRIHRFHCHIHIVHPSGHQHRLSEAIPDFFHQGQIHALVEIHRRMGPIPGVIGTGITVEGIIACLFQNRDSFPGFADVTPQFLEGFSRNGALTDGFDVTLNGEPQNHREIGAAGLFNLLDNLTGKPQTSPEVAAVFIGTLIKQGHGKAVQQIAFMDGVNFNAVKAAVLADQSCLSEGLDDGLDLFGL